MRVDCPYCKQKSLITDSISVLKNGKTAFELYCQCLNTKECGAGFVYTLSYKGFTKPPETSTAQLAADLDDDTDIDLDDER